MSHRTLSLVPCCFLCTLIISQQTLILRLIADDCVCYREMKDTEDTLKLQKDIDQLGCRARKWGMRFQPIKCNMMQITRKRINKIHASYTLEVTVLENDESIKYLWVHYHKWFAMDTHVSNICTKANRTLSFLRRKLYACPQEVKEAAYKGLVRPVLEYKWFCLGLLGCRPSE